MHGREIYLRQSRRKSTDRLVVSPYRVISIRGVVCLFFMGANNGGIHKPGQDLAAIP